MVTLVLDTITLRKNDCWNIIQWCTQPTKCDSNFLAWQLKFFHTFFYSSENLKSYTIELDKYSWSSPPSAKCFRENGEEDLWNEMAECL